MMSFRDQFINDWRTIKMTTTKVSENGPKNTVNKYIFK